MFALPFEVSFQSYISKLPFKHTFENYFGGDLSKLPFHVTFLSYRYKAVF